MRIINLTPHTLNIHTGTEVLNIEPSGQVARVCTLNEAAPSVAGIPVAKTSYGAAEGLPAAEEGTILIVSGMVEAAAPRADVFAPGELLRNAEGQPIGCNGLKQTA